MQISVFHLFSLEKRLSASIGFQLPTGCPCLRQAGAPCQPYMGAMRSLSGLPSETVTFTRILVNFIKSYFTERVAMEKHISATDAVREFSELLNRVKFRGERYIIERR
jgi:hypothetical protein